MGPALLVAYPETVGKTWATAVLAIALGVSATAAAAEESTAPEQRSSYQGVTPGSDNPPPKAEEIPEGAHMLTWPGFMMRKEGASCFFIQTSQPVEFASKKSEGRFELVLRNTKVHLENNFRPLETQYFDTPVTRATVQRKGQKDLVVVFEMRDDVTPTIKQEKGKDGFNYVFVELPPRP